MLRLKCTNQTEILKSDLPTWSCCFWALLRRNVSLHNWTIVIVMSCSLHVLHSHISNFQFSFLALCYIFISPFYIFYFPFFFIFPFFHLLIYNFQVLPYWGNQGDRKSLRKYWTQVHYLYLWQGSKITIKKQSVYLLWINFISVSLCFILQNCTCYICLFMLDTF